MNPLFQKIREISEESARNNNLFPIDFILRGTNTNPVIEVFVDGTENVSAESCAAVSNQIRKAIDQESIFSSYRLDVSSPGVERPLIYIEQFPKHTNRMFEVQYRTGETIQKLKAILKGVQKNVLTFYTDTEIQVKFEDIIKAKVLVSFNQRR